MLNINNCAEICVCVHTESNYYMYAFEAHCKDLKARNDTNTHTPIFPSLSVQQTPWDTAPTEAQTTVSAFYAELLMK